MAAIPDAGGARYAPTGVARALVRVVVLGGLVVAGWILGAGIGHASEALGQPGAGLVQLGSDPGDNATPSEAGSIGQFGMPPVVMSAVKKAGIPTAVVPRLHVRPVGVLKPAVKAVGVVKPLKPLAHVLDPVARTMSAPPLHGTGIQVQAPTNTPAVVPPVEPARQPAAATAPAPAVQRALPAAPACATAAPATKPFADQLVRGEAPATPIPASPAGNTTAPCMISAAGSGTSTKSGPDVAVKDDWATAGITPTQRVRYLSADDLLRSPAERPSTSPD